MSPYQADVSSNSRKELIKKIEELRKSRVIVYFTGDRQPTLAAISEDAVRPLYEHLVSLGEADRIDLFVYSRGGDVSVPWRIVSMFREFCKEFSVLIPYKAYSAATMLALGADQVIMGRKAELGPIDPTLERMAKEDSPSLPPQKISVEDVNSYISFIRERANINDQLALAQVVSKLVDSITPLTLGNVDRLNSHIRLVSRKLLTSRLKKMEEEKITSIIETLTEKIYFHGHAIGRKEANEIGLPVEAASGELEQVMWQLFLEYEKYLKLDNPIDLMVTLNQNQDEEVVRVEDISNTPIAIIESEKLLHQFSAQYDVLRRRAPPPPDPKISVNIGLGLPPHIKKEEIPQELQQVIQGQIDGITKMVQELIRREIYKQAPETGFDVRSYGGKWQETGRRP